MAEIETKMVECLRPLLGDMAAIALNIQKKKLGLSPPLDIEDYKKLAEGLRDMCEEMAGTIIANKIYETLLGVLENI